MRDLEQNELQYISGGCAPTPPSSGCGCSPSSPSRSKRNNGFGNGADSDRSAPGGSGKTGGGKEGSDGIPGRGER